MVITPHGYTKHYYAGSERIATAIGGGGLDSVIHPIDTISPQEEDNYHGKFLQYYSQTDPFRYHHEIGDIVPVENIAGQQLNEIQYQCHPLELHIINLSSEENIFRPSITSNAHYNGIERDIYFYHGDHLGSAHWITERHGDPIQYIHYLPYGEILANQHTTYNERFKFTGKELDAESGYYYFGARYLLSELGNFISSDPLSDKYPEIQSYLYCNGNPLKYIDPSGMSTHTNEEGLVIAVYDDNDLNIYKHSNAQLESWGDVYSNHLTVEGAKVIGKSLHALSFADQGKYNETGKVSHADGMIIDFGSTALGDAIQEVVDSKPSLVKYALNARSKHNWDFKEQAQYKNHGSQIFDGVYLSPRDAGNVLAGAIKRQSGLLAPMVQFGYGAYNLTNNSIPGTAILTIGTAILMYKHPQLGIPTAAIIMSGENKLTQLSIDLGYKYYGGK